MLRMRPAVVDDLPDLMRMLLDGRATPSDELAPDSECYAAALREMQADERNRTYVAEEDARVLGTLQLTFIRHILRRGALVAQVESVRVDAPMRNRGIGAFMMRWAIDEARRLGCSRIQLTTHKTREPAHRFYERLGFVKSHEGMKLLIDP